MLITEHDLAKDTSFSEGIDNFTNVNAKKNYELVICTGKLSFSIPIFQFFIYLSIKCDK